MKNGKKLLILASVLLVLCIGTFAASQWTVEPVEEEAVTTETVFTLEPEAVTALTWEYSESLSFRRESEGWVYPEDPVFPVEESYLDTILQTLSRVDSYKTIDTVENWDTYGLQIPVCTISVTAGETYDLAIGIETTLGGQRYFSIGDGKVYLVDDAILEPFQYDLYDLIAAREMPEVTQVTAMEVTTPEGSYAITYEPGSGKAYSDSYVWFWEDQPLDTDLAQELTRLVTNLNLAQCVNFNADDLSQYGLAEPEIQVTIFDSGTEAYTLDISSATDDGCYVRLPGTNMVYRTLATVNETLRYTTVADLLPRDVLLMDWDTVEAVTIQDHRFTAGREETTDDEGNVTEQTVWLPDGEGLGELLEELTSLSATGLATGLTPQGEPMLTMTVTRQQEAFSQVTLSVYPYSSDSCLVTLDGVSTVTVNREKMAALVASFTEILENS